MKLLLGPRRCRKKYIVCKVNWQCQDMSARTEMSYGDIRRLEAFHMRCLRQQTPEHYLAGSHHQWGNPGDNRIDAIARYPVPGEGITWSCRLIRSRCFMHTKPSGCRRTFPLVGSPTSDGVTTVDWRNGPQGLRDDDDDDDVKRKVWSPCFLSARVSVALYTNSVIVVTDTVVTLHW